jgi:ABC-type multidrug transport system ATPase subunit
MKIFRTNGVSGKVYVNGKERNPDQPHKFQRLSRYIQQDDSLRPHLTVGEAMTITAHLKLGYTVGSDKKKNLVRNT